MSNNDKASTCLGHHLDIETQIRNSQKESNLKDSSLSFDVFSLSLSIRTAKMKHFVK